MKSGKQTGKSKNSHIKSLIITIYLISFVFIYLVYSGNFIFGSVEGRWTYEYFREFSPFPLSVFLIVIALFGLSLIIGKRFLLTREKWVLGGTLVIAVIIQALMQSTYIYSLGELIESNISNSFYTPAIRFSTFEVLSQFQKGLPGLTAHAVTNMPGKILFFQFLGLFTKSPQIMGYLIILISSLGGLLLYAITKHLFQNKIAGFYTLLLYILIPCKVFFLPILNTVTPIFILLALFFLIRYLESKKILFLVLMGITLYGLVIFEPSPLVMGLLFVGILLYYIGQKKATRKDVLQIVLIPTAVFIFIYLLMLWIFSFDLWGSFQYMLKDAVAFNASAKRNYIVWIKEDLKALFFDAGLPVFIIFIYYFVELFVQRKIYSQNFFKWSAEHFYILSLALTFAVVLILGINRGETTRLWIYMAVFFQVPAALFFAKEVENDWLFFGAGLTLILQILVTLQRVAFIAI